MAKRDAFEIGGVKIEAGSRQTVDIVVSLTSDHTPVTLPVHVVHGRRPGPTIFVSAAIHGDEIIGVEIVRRLLGTKSLDKLKGTLLAVPIVNSLGFLNHSRYMPDRRDLNRCFPGSPEGSLAARIAHIFMTEIVERSSVGIDLHSAAIHRDNLPQVRVEQGDKETLALAKVFAAPLVLTSELREGSLRAAAKEKETKILLLEAGEGLRFDEFAIRVGVTGILRVMHHMGMISRKHVSKAKTEPMISDKSYWQRAPEGGLLRIFRTNGDFVQPGDVLGIVADPFGEQESEVIAKRGGLIIGRTNLPVVNEGDALFHIAKVTSADDAEETIDSLTSQLDSDPLFYEDEII